MLLLLYPQTAPLGLTLSTSSALQDTLYRLGFQNPSDLNQADWLTALELQQWANQAVQHLGVSTSAFLTFDTSMLIVPGTAQYTLPVGHGFTVLAALVGANQVLWITPAVELWALDANWQAQTGAPARCSLDAGGLGTATLYPVPVANDTLAQVLQQVPSQTGTLPLPQVLQDYFSTFLILNARLKESDHRMQDVAQHLQERIKLWDQVVTHLYGSGE